MAQEFLVREELLEPLRRTLGWILSLRDPEGRIVCPDHKVEHTGKSACTALLALELARCDRAEHRGWLLEAAREQGRRVASRLRREGTSECHTFQPGLHDPFNCSNHIIDGGAASDALSELVQSAGAELSAREREEFARASVLHARTYLRYAVLDKGVPAQRAWGLTGLCNAWRLDPDAELERSALDAIEALVRIQNQDGSYPYQPLEWSETSGQRGQSPQALGASDVSAFYQSRVTAFLLFSLERLGRSPAADEFRRSIVSGLEFLLALQGPDGVKCGLVEAKPWYWGATYEVASHPFDVYALARGWRQLGVERFADGALRSFRAWVDHLGADGRPTSHRSGPGRGRSFQCPLFWASHAMWLARSAPDLEHILRRPSAPKTIGSGLEVGVSHFRAADLARIEDGRIVAWVRGKRPEGNANHGSPHGGGLLRVLRKDGAKELVARCPFGGEQDAEWSARAGRGSPARGWRSGGGDLAFSLWLARVHYRAGRPRAAVLGPMRAFARGVLAFASSRAASGFHRWPELRAIEGGVVLRGALAHRDGAVVEGSKLERTFQVDGEGLVVTDRMCSAGSARDVRYRVPAAASAVVRTAEEIRYRLA